MSEDDFTLYNNYLILLGPIPIFSPHPSPLCSEIPQELLSAARGGEVDINIQDKRTEAYTKPKPKLVAFSGHGQKLGRCVA
jgi:hypothetical protein